MKRCPQIFFFYYNENFQAKFISLIVHTTQHQKTQTTELKNGQNLIDIFQRGNADGQEAHEKMLNIANHHGNANQNHHEISPHTCQNGYNQKVYK